MAASLQLALWLPANGAEAARRAAARGYHAAALRRLPNEALRVLVYGGPGVKVRGRVHRRMIKQAKQTMSQESAVRKRGTKRDRIARDDPDARRDVLLRAKDYLRSSGYARVTIRALAEHLGVGASSLYYHFPNKVALLNASIEIEMDELVAEALTVRDADISTIDQLKMFIAKHLSFQLELAKMIEGRRGSLRGVYAMMDELSDTGESPLLTKQRRYIDILKSILDRGREEGVFAIDDLTVTAYAVMSLGEHLVNWFRPGGRLSAEEVQQMLSDLAMRIVAKAPTR